MLFVENALELYLLVGIILDRLQITRPVCIMQQIMQRVPA
jgi:hypothetical protein